MTRNGGCFCGTTRYRVDGDSTGVDHCHCKHCRRTAGAPFITWATFGTSRVTFEKGTPKYYRSRKLPWMRFDDGLPYFEERRKP